MKNFFRFQILFGLFLMTLFCQSQSAQTFESKNDSSRHDEKTNKLVESFSDKLKIGVPRKNKIEIFNYKKSNGNIAVIKFYTLGANKEWKLKQNFEYEKDDLLGIDPEIKDFNNDGFRDVTYVSKTAARGANEVRKLFVYDRNKDALIYIKNSEEYPNLLYNRTLKCLDAQRFYGGTATDFVRIEGDELKIFAYVETTGSERKVYLVNKNGKEKLLRTDKVSEAMSFERYKTFNPPTAYRAGDFKQ